MVLKYKIGLILFIILALFFSGCLGKDHLPKPMSGDFVGTVQDALTEEGISGVEVDFGSEYTAVTNKEGKFSFSTLPPGIYQAKFNRSWYRKLSVSYNHIGPENGIVFKMNEEQDLVGGILYSHDDGADNKREIYYLDLKTRQTRKVYQSPLSETQPAWMGNNKILFCSGQNNSYDIYCYDLSSGKVEQICPHAANDEHPSADQSGNIIVFQSIRNGQTEIFTYHYGSNQLLQPIDKGKYPKINRDGTQLAYVDGSNNLWIYNLGTGVSRKINHLGKISNPCWSPDGTKIIMESWVNTGDLHRISVITPGLSEALQPVTYTYQTSDDHKHPFWSEDGSIIFFSANINKSRYDIYAIRLNDSILMGAQAPLIMITGGSGDKDYPVWADLNF